VVRAEVKQESKPEVKAARPHVHRPVAASPRYNDEDPSTGRLEMETQPDSPGVPELDKDEAGGPVLDPKGFVVLTIGLPGSGKTTWYKRRGVTPLSSDLLRTILFDDI